MAERETRLFLCGDVMTGRGVDQVLPHSCPPGLHESSASSALDYVGLAEQANGPIPRPVGQEYVWGAALEVLRRARPDARIINLETSITTSDQALPKGINYRMHPANVGVLTAAGIDCCALANNHVLDWGEAGFLETLEVLERAGVRVAGGGRNLHAASAPARLPLPDGRRILVFAFGAGDCGIPHDWAATTSRAGINLVPDYSARSIDRIARRVNAETRPGDTVIASIHWGGNWGYDIPAVHRRFARALVEQGVDVVHGHSSHHPKAIEVHNGRLILYGCGDFIDDYEGIRGYEAFRDDLVLMYLPVLGDTGRLLQLRMTPLQIRNFRLNPVSADDRVWLCDTMDRECRRFAHRVRLDPDGLRLEWP
jgi:poly-gamma-glutamate synthesis protein (capsule biosynthesis protein)